MSESRVYHCHSRLRVFDADLAEPDKYRYDVKLTDIETCEVFYDKLTFIYLEMPKFNKPVDQLKSRFDKWMFVIRNLNKLDRIPEELTEKIFLALFEAAEIAKFSKVEADAYEESLKSYRDLKNSDTAFEEEGRRKRQKRHGRRKKECRIGEKGIKELP